jgi:catechol 2,3-dioxygenase-like lactoylglutathione lyase family enzyme
MRIDHLAFRVSDRFKTAAFFCNALGYTICPKVGSDGFRVDFDNGTWADCLVLRPPERPTKPEESLNSMVFPWTFTLNSSELSQTYHTPAEIFISQGSPGSIVHNWVMENGNGLHHIAVQVDNIEKTCAEWKEKGFATFSSPEILRCDGLKQIFTDPSELTGVIWELIERSPEADGFCKENVRDLMIASYKSN